MLPRRGVDVEIRGHLAERDSEQLAKIQDDNNSFVFLLLRLSPRNGRSLLGNETLVSRLGTKREGLLALP